MPEAAPKFYDCSYVAIATGLHVTLNIPRIPGIEHVVGDVFHLSQYKHRSQLANRRVLILGCGETAMDIAYEAIKADAKSITMCFQQAFFLFPRFSTDFKFLGKPQEEACPLMA